MSQQRMRPRFAVEVSGQIEDVMTALRESVAAREDLEGDFSSRHGVVRFPETKKHFWSPFLSLTIESSGDDQSTHPTRVRGVFSPHPHIWQAFVFIYLTLFATGFFAAMFGFAQLFLGRNPLALLITLAAALLAGFVYGATFIGQGLGADEMYTLRRFLDESIEVAEDRANRRPRTSRESAQL